MDTTYQTQTRTDGNGQPYNVQIPTDISPTTSATTLGTQPVVIPPTTNPDANLTPTIQSISQGYQNQIEQAQNNDTTAQNQYDVTANTLKNLQTQLGGQSADTANLQNEQGIPQMNKELNDLTALGQQQTAQYLNKINAQNVGGTGTIGGVSAQETAINRQHAIDALMTNSLIQAKQGNIQFAQNLVDKAISAKYDPIKAQIQANQDFLQANYQNLSRADQKLAAAQSAKNALDLKQLENLQSIQSDAIKNAIQNKAPSSVIDAISKAATIGDIATAGGGFIQDTYKAMQTAELAQKISTANTAQDLGGIVSPVTQLPDGTYDTATQDAILAKMTPEDAALVKQVGTYQMDISKITSLRSDQRQALAAKVALVYPGFQMSQYAANAAYRKGLTSTSLTSPGGIINSANKVLNHLTDFANNVSDLNNGGISASLNAFRNKTAQPFSSTLQNRMAMAQTDAIGVTDELAKFFKGTGVADAKTIADWQARINPNSTPSQLRGTVQSAIDLLQGQLVPMIDQYKQTIGTNPPDGLFLKADTVSKLSQLKNQGFKIDIPGVIYTDKTAWQKYGGGTQDQWNKAVDTLTNAGMPVTEENILQVAQMQ